MYVCVIFLRPFLLLIFYSSETDFTRLNDRWTGLYIKLCMMIFVNTYIKNI